MFNLDPLWLDELFEFLRIPSVSADPTHNEDVHAAALWIRDFICRIGGNCELKPPLEHPLVLGELSASAKYSGKQTPTVILYAHYDVQPPGSLENWNSNPFQPEIRDGWIYGRGASDPKGQLFILLKAAESLAKENELPINIRIISDGDEEINADTVTKFIHNDEHSANACLILNHPMPIRGLPFFVIGTKGLLFYHISVRTGEHDMHSGLFGGVAMNAGHALVRVLSSITSLPKELTIGCTPPTEEELRDWNQLPLGSSLLKAQHVAPADNHATEEYYIRVYSLPVINIHGITCGETILHNSILPVEAEAALSIRLAPGQDIDLIRMRFENLLIHAAPSESELIINLISQSPPALLSPDTPALRLAIDAFQNVFNKRPLLIRTGGTLPLFPALVKKGIPVVFTGFDVPEGNIHSPNERFLCEHIGLGVEAVRQTLLAFAALK
jgi:acetylornithine deacetylase/succinyl-diaminopimelate desuccinylase-like protein